jgi:hypothetical protein
MFEFGVAGIAHDATGWVLGGFYGGGFFFEFRRKNTQGTNRKPYLGALLHFDKAHAAVARNREPLVVAKARHLDAGGLARLGQGGERKRQPL